MHTCYTAIGAASELCMLGNQGQYHWAKSGAPGTPQVRFAECGKQLCVVQRIGAVREAHQSWAYAWSCVQKRGCWRQRTTANVARQGKRPRVEVNVAALAILEGAGAGFNLAAASADAYCRLNREIFFFQGLFVSFFMN